MTQAPDTAEATETQPASEPTPVHPPEAAAIPGQELAAPGRPVGPVARAVERDPDDRLGQPILGHAARHMRMVVLNREEFGSLPSSLAGVSSWGITP